MGPTTDRAKGCNYAFCSVVSKVKCDRERCAGGLVELLVGWWFASIIVIISKKL